MNIYTINIKTAATCNYLTNMGPKNTKKVIAECKN